MSLFCQFFFSKRTINKHIQEQKLSLHFGYINCKCQIYKTFIDYLKTSAILLINVQKFNKCFAYPHYSLYFLFYYFPKRKKLINFFFTNSLSKEHRLRQSFNSRTFTPLLLPLVAKDSSRLKLFLKVTMNGKPQWVRFVCGFSLLHFINCIQKNGVFIYLLIYLVT